MRPRHRHERGQTLPIVVVLLVVLTLLALGMVSRSNQSNDEAAAVRRHDVGVSCAEGARQMLMSQLSIYGTNPTQVVLNRTVGGDVYATGHYDNIAVASVTQETGSQSGLTGATDIANHTGKSMPGGKVYRMTVVCQSNGANQQEVEFLVRLGL